MSKKFVKKLTIKPAAIAAPLTSKPKKSPSKVQFADEILATYSSTTTAYTLKADNAIFDYGIAELPDPNYEPPLKKIVGMDITWLTSSEIDNMATVVIRSSKTSGEGSVYDSCFGVNTNHEMCPICSKGWKECPGHPGVIKFPFPIPHPILLRELSECLTCVCEFCHRLVLTWKQMKTLGILRYRGENRFKAYLDHVKKVVRCKNCNKPHGKYSVVDDKFYKAYKKKGEVKKIPISYDEVVEIISNIRESEWALLGQSNPLCHPKHMIINNLFVLPICARPFVESNNCLMHDDLTHKYIEIYKSIAKLSEKGLTEKNKLDHMDTLMFHVKTMMDNSKSKARDPNGKRALKAIKQRISGKSGIVRQNMQGKRTVQCVTGDAIVNLSSGLSVRLDQIDSSTNVLGYDVNSKSLVSDHKIAFFDKGEQECFELIFQDGSTLTTTDDHQIMLFNRGWTKLKDIQPGMMVKKSIHYPSYDPVSELDPKWSLSIGPLKFSADTLKEYEKTLALCRLLGIILTDGCIFREKRNNVIRSQICLGCLLDAQMVVEDIFLLTGKRPTISDYTSTTQNNGAIFNVNLPTELSREFKHLEVCIGRRVTQASTLPKFILDPACPRGLVREFLGGLFGGDGHTPKIDPIRNIAGPVAFSQSKAINHLENGKQTMSDISILLKRFGITESIIRKETYYRTAKRDEEMCAIRLNIPIKHLVQFVDLIGFRYCVDKQMKSTIVASYVSMQQKIRSQANDLLMMINDKSSYIKGGRGGPRHTNCGLKSVLPQIFIDYCASTVVLNKKAITPDYRAVLYQLRNLRIGKTPIHNFSTKKLLSFVDYSKLLGVDEWFEPHSYVMDRKCTLIPTYNSIVLAKRSVGLKKVYDISMQITNSFTANGVVVHNCGRSVISPDPNMHVNEVGMPREIADKLTVPVRVQTYNLAKCQQWLEDGQINVIKDGDRTIDARFAVYSRGFKLQHGDTVIREGKCITPPAVGIFQIKNGDEVIRTEFIEKSDGEVEVRKTRITEIEPSKRKQFKLRIGMIVERKLQARDFILFNRQPTGRNSGWEQGTQSVLSPSLCTRMYIGEITH